jgi:assimilatory nitrate reductase catalytic subunit
MVLPAKVVATIRPDTVFIPYHWAGRQAANQLTNRALDPYSKIPEYKVSAVRIERAGLADVPVVDARDMELH